MAKLKQRKKTIHASSIFFAAQCCERVDEAIVRGLVRGRGKGQLFLLLLILNVMFRLALLVTVLMVSLWSSPTLAIINVKLCKDYSDCATCVKNSLLGFCKLVFCSPLLCI